VKGTHLCKRCNLQRDVRNAKAKKRNEQERTKREGTTTQRGYDYQWSRVSQLIRRSEPICRRCKNALAQMVDHIKPLKEGGDRLDLANLQPLCNKCHSSKTREDYKRLADQQGNGGVA
jgi:5-methylcytosine-specific restriction protein A